jgi:hypothetical protein
MMKVVILAMLAVAAVQETGLLLRGVVANAVTQQPVAGTRVMLIRPDAIAGSVVVSTDDRGRFAFENLQPATYRVLAEHDDYVRELTGEIAIERDRTPVAVNLMLTPTAVISGRVTDEFGDPVGKIYVRARTTRVVAEVRTNDLGEYRLFGLPPDTYVITAERYQGPTIQNNRVNTPTPPCPDCRGEGTMTQPLPAILTSGGFIDPRALTGQTYPEVFHSGTTERSAATPIKAGPGARIDGIDLQLIVR